MNYKQLVAILLALEWKRLLTYQELTELIYISWVTASEFASSLRLTLELYPEDEKLKQLAKGELDTRNLCFDGYREKGDHSKFLYAFLCNANVFNAQKNLFPGMIRPEVERVGIEYLRRISMLPKEVRAMSIISREKELSGFFAKILENPLFAERFLPKHLKAYRYYLKRHIYLDSKEGGHEDLSQHIAVDERLVAFYSVRLNLYAEAFGQFKKYTVQ